MKRRIIAIFSAGTVLLLLIAFLPLGDGSNLAGLAWSFGERLNPKFVEQVCRLSRQTFSIFGSQNPFRLRAQYALGCSLFRQHRYLESISYLAELANSEGDRTFDLQTKLDLRYVLACDFWYTKDYSMSAQRFAEAAELANKTQKSLKYKIEIAKWRIKALVRSAQWAEADAIVSETKSLITKSGSNSAKLVGQLSLLSDEVLKSEYRFDELEDRLEHASDSTNKTSSEFSANTERRLGWLSLRRHHHEEALQHFNNVLSHLPRDGYALWNLGICYDLQGKNELAFEYYAKYLKTADFKDSVDNYRKKEVVAFKKYCVSDYFAAEAARASWGRWPKQALPVKVYISRSATQGFNELTTKEIFKCLNRWQLVLSDSLSYVVVDSEEKAQLVFSRVDSGYEFNDSGNYDGMTYICTDKRAGWGPSQFNFVKIKLADIDMRTVSPEKIERVHSLLLHEIGHALGLRTHSPNAGDIMFQSALRADLSPRDIATMRMIYAPDAAAKAKSLVNDLAADDCVYARYSKAFYLQRNGDYKQALEELKLAYNQHFAEAATQIGLMYLGGGPNFPQNYEKALLWFERGAMRGDRSANTRIGDIYQFGNGVRKYPEKAVSYYQKAAESGDREAHRKLGLAYCYGSGIEKDAFQSFQWLRKAALENDGEAQQCLAYAYHFGLGTRKDDSLALTWYTAAAKNRVAVAESWLGYFYSKGLTGPVNISKARYWYDRAAKNGDAYAVTALRKLGSQSTVESHN